MVEPRGEQERLLAGWGELLGQYAVERGVVSHLSWSDLAQPSGMGDHIAWLGSADRGAPTQAALASSTRFIELDAAAWSNNTVRVMARNISGATFDLAAATLAVQVTKRRVP